MRKAVETGKYLARPGARFTNTSTNCLKKMMKTKKPTTTSNCSCSKATTRTSCSCSLSIASFCLCCHQTQQAGFLSHARNHRTLNPSFRQHTAAEQQQQPATPMALFGMVAPSVAMKPLATPVKLSSSTFFQGGKLACCSSSVARPALMPGFSLQVEAMKKVQGKVVCATSDKTVAVEVFRIAPHPKYKKRIKTSKKYQAHDPYNSCKVGDTVTLVKCAPVSKTKAFLVTEIRAAKVAVRKVAAASELSIPLESAAAPPS